jgi:hypothetical protein
MVQHGSQPGPTPMPESTLQMFLSKKVCSGIQTNTQRKLNTVGSRRRDC